MAMPKASVNENRTFSVRHDNVRRTGQRFSMKSIWDFERPQYLAHRLFWRRMTLPHARHQSASLGVERASLPFDRHWATS
jgi:hypothetical protein